MHTWPLKGRKALLQLLFSIIISQDLSQLCILCGMILYQITIMYSPFYLIYFLLCNSAPSFMGSMSFGLL